MLLKWGNRIWRRARDERGFTLVELLIVMVIIAVLAGLGYTGYNAIRERAKRAEADTLWRDLSTAVKMVELEGGSAAIEDYLDLDAEPWSDTARVVRVVDATGVCVTVDGVDSTHNNCAGS